MRKSAAAVRMTLLNITSSSLGFIIGAFNHGRRARPNGFVFVPKIKIGHSLFQIRPLGVETGQHPKKTPQPECRNQGGKIVLNPRVCCVSIGVPAWHLVPTGRAFCACQNVLNDVAIPYLKEIKSAMAGNFTFDVQRDVTSNRTLGVKFEVKGRHPVSIKLIGGSIQVRIHTGGGMIYPEIKVPSDLSKEKLGALVQTIIEG
jgi:hypothetical protein